VYAGGQVFIGSCRCFLQPGFFLLLPVFFLFPERKKRGERVATELLRLFAKVEVRGQSPVSEAIK
jgi:hypothetical protein